MTQIVINPDADQPEYISVVGSTAAEVTENVEEYLEAHGYERDVDHTVKSE